MDVYHEKRVGRRIEPSVWRALNAVSRVSKLPTWTRVQAAPALAGSPGTGIGRVVSGPYDDRETHLGRMVRVRSWPETMLMLVV